jgi:hypothetical protein
MDYLTKFYKHQAEQLAERVEVLQSELKYLSEAEAPASVFRGTGQGQQRFSDLELEAQMRRFKTTGFFGAEVADDKQRQEYRDAKAELERRRGAGKQQAPAPTPAPAPAPARTPAPAPRPPVEQMGPPGAPSAVPTKTEVQKTQAVADKTGVPTALPTNTAPGTMSMTDMDGNPIAVQPTPKQPEGPVLGRVTPKENTPEARKDLEDSAMGKGAYKPTPVQPPAPARAPVQPTASDNLVSRAFGVPSRAPGTMVNPSDSTAVKLPSNFHGTGNMPPVDADVQAADKPGRWSTNWNEFINSMRPQTPTVPGMSKPLARSTQFDSPFGTSQTSAYGTPPSAQYAPTESQVGTPVNPAVGSAPAEAPQARDTSGERMVSGAARQALPSVVKDVVKSPAPTQKPAEEDFSKFWAGKPRYGDLDLQNMMRQHRRTAIGGKELPPERQSIEYRAARAELIRRGKLKG